MFIPYFFVLVAFSADEKGKKMFTNLTAPCTDKDRTYVKFWQQLESKQRSNLQIF